MSDLIKRLEELFGPFPEKDVVQKVFVKVTHYEDFVRVYVPHKPYYKNLSDLEPVKKKGYVFQPGSVEEDFERSIRRTKNTIRDYVLCNKFDLFVTFTFSSDREDINKTKTKMNNWIKNQQKRKGRFEYLIVPEFHKDGQSLHFHALLKDYTGELLEAVNPKTGKPLKQKGRQVYSLANYTLGFSNAIKIEDTPESHQKVGNYVRKYITKDMPRFHNKNRYWASRGLETPEIDEDPSHLYEGVEPHWQLVTEYGIIRDYSIEDIKKLEA